MRIDGLSDEWIEGAIRLHEQVQTLTSQMSLARAEHAVEPIFAAIPDDDARPREEPFVCWRTWRVAFDDGEPFLSGMTGDEEGMWGGRYWQPGEPMDDPYAYPTEAWAKRIFFCSTRNGVYPRDELYVLGRVAVWGHRLPVTANHLYTLRYEWGLPFALHGAQDGRPVKVMSAAEIRRRLGTTYGVPVVASGQA